MALDRNGFCKDGDEEVSRLLENEPQALMGGQEAPKRKGHQDLSLNILKHNDAQQALTPLKAQLQEHENEAGRIRGELGEIEKRIQELQQRG